MSAPSDPTALVAELRAGKVGPLPDGWDMGHYEEAVQRLLDRAAALIAQQAATIEASHEHYSFTADELLAVAGAIGSTRFMDPPDGGDVTLAEQVKRMSAALTAAEAERDRAREALEAAKGWLEGWASAERELAVIDAALSTAKGLGE